MFNYSKVSEIQMLVIVVRWTSLLYAGGRGATMAGYLSEASLPRELISGEAALQFQLSLTSSPQSLSVSIS